MIGKLGYILLFLQLCHFAMANKTLAVDPLQIALSRSYDTNFPFQIGNKIYHIEHNLKVNWYQAAHNCRKLGGNLLNIESSLEMDAILSILPVGLGSESRYWISSNCLAKNRDFISITSGVVMPYTRWYPGEPNNQNGNEFCVELLIYALNDYTCNSLLKYICEAKLVN